MAYAVSYAEYAAICPGQEPRPGPYTERKKE